MKDLINTYKNDQRILDTNGHIHTPYSFSSFESIEQIFEMAKEEGIDVIGINDFFTVEGYEDFAAKAKEANKYPLFNIEFIGLLEDLQAKGVKINDPNNPGRIYFSGKGLKFPFSVSKKNEKFIDNLIVESQKQVKEMADKANDILKTVNNGMGLSYEQVKADYAENLVRERHIAKAIKNEVFASANDKSLRTELFKQVFGGKEVKSDINNATAIENEIRSNLLKSGGAAFVAETKESFPPLQDIIDFIKDAGGIPCYPVLLDDKKGNILTDFESDWEKMTSYLENLGVNCVELIPSRNSVAKLTEFVEFFRGKGFVVAMGSEHNTPGIFPLEVKVEGELELTDYLKKVAYESCCVIAAHQTKVANSEAGYSGANDYEAFVELGNAVIKEAVEK